jgi:quinol monooxygenase YgiN
MAIMVLLEGKAKPESVDRLKAALANLFPETRRYEGCQGITAYTGADDGLAVAFVEHWDTRAHHERYLRWRTETGVIAELVGMLEAPPNIRYFEPTDA